MHHQNPRADTDAWATIVDQYAAQLETVQQSLRDEDWERLAAVQWVTPPRHLAPPPDSVQEHLGRLLHMSQSLQRSITTEMQAVQEELGRGAQVRKANRAYLRASGTAPDTPPAAR